MNCVNGGVEDGLGEQADGVVVESSDIRNYRHSRYLVGTARNTSDQTLTLAQVSFDLFSEFGAKVGTTTAKVSDLGPGETWEFEAPISGENVTTWRFSDTPALGVGTARQAQSGVR